LQQKERYRDSPDALTGLVGSPGSRGCHVFGGGKRNVSPHTKTKSEYLGALGESTVGLQSVDPVVLPQHTTNYYVAGVMMLLVLLPPFVLA
jgi:hypothetical protein